MLQSQCPDFLTLVFWKSFSVASAILDKRKFEDFSLLITCYSFNTAYWFDTDKNFIVYLPLCSRLS